MPAGKKKSHRSAHGVIRGVKQPCASYSYLIQRIIPCEEVGGGRFRASGRCAPNFAQG